MYNIVAKEIEKYCEEHSTPMGTIFEKLKTRTYQTMKAPHMQVGALEGSFLQLLINCINAKRILELGTFTGYSALAMAEALPEDGELITCDIDPAATAVAQEFWSQSEHGKKIKLRMGPALATIASLDLEFELDLVFIDADKGNYINYWDACIPKLRRGGLMVVDNVLWSGRVLNPVEKSDHHIVSFNEHAKNDSRVKLVLLPIRDGMLIARKI
ncbi:MAG: class I SAM-dependent methyltransferase [Bacteriovoracaceae bacterium]|nr:class I SAM-dependent methyltransferase [Bacteriovoracaceae bacterium]